MSERVTTYESLDDRIAPESVMKDMSAGLEIVDGHAVKAPGDYEDPDQLFDMLIARIRKYHPSTDVSMIRKAYETAKKAHGDQCRKSGEPYIIHPLWVAIILADLEMDKETIAAGLLHDVVEDTKMTLEDVIQGMFGEEVALLVDGVTKLGQLSYSSRTSWKCRRRICGRCSWPWPRISGSSSSSWRTVCTICGRCSL